MPSRPRHRFNVYKTRHTGALQTIKRRRVFTGWSRFLILFYMNGRGVTFPSCSFDYICFQNNAKRELVRPPSLFEYWQHVECSRNMTTQQIWNSLREKCPNTEFFQLRIFLCSDRIRRFSDQKKVLIWTLFTQWLFWLWQVVSSYLIFRFLPWTYFTLFLSVFFFFTLNKFMLAA